MTEKHLFQGRTRGYVAPYEGQRHRAGRETVEIAFRIRYSMLDDINARFLADPTVTTFAEYMRKVTIAGLEALNQRTPQDAKSKDNN